MKRHTFAVLASAVAAAASFRFVARVDAQTTWIHDPATAGDWFTPANWSAGVPVNSLPAFVNNGGTVEFTGATSSAFINQLHIGTGSLDSGALLLSGGLLSAGTTFVGESGRGWLIQTDGRISSNVRVGENVGSQGTVVFSNGTFASSATIGFSGSGTLIQNGGSLGGNIELGVNVGSAGTFLLNGGFCRASIDIGTGTVIQSGGVMNPSSFSMNQGDYFRLDGGLFSPLSTLQVGWAFGSGAGSAMFVQSGGTVSLGTTSLNVGFLSNGGYQLNDGTVTAGSLTVGSVFGGSGTFVQNGGTVGVAQGISVAATGLFQLGPGTTLSSGSISNTGAFIQSGGTNVTGSMTLNTGARYVLGGGTLVLNQGLVSVGTFDFAGGSGRLVYGNITDLGTGSLLNPSNATVIGLPGSLLVVPAGFDPSTGFGSFSTQGAVHTAGTTLSIPAGSGYALSGVFNDHVDLAGTLDGSGLSLRKGISVMSGGSATVGSLTVADLTSGISGGGTLAAFAINVGSNGAGGTGAFIQSGGVASATFVNVGQSSGNAGTYSLSGGSLSAFGLQVLSTGRFEQSGGSASFGSVFVNPGGTFRWGGGTFATTGPTTIQGIVDFANATQTLTVQTLYDLSQATLINGASTTLIGAPNSLIIFRPGIDPATQFASFSSQGIVHTAGTTLIVPADKSFAGTGAITDRVQLSGSLSQLNLLGGINVLPGAAGSLSSVVVNDLASGMSGGSITISSFKIGASAPGMFVQSGGSLTYGQLNIGSSSTATGTFVLNGGALTGGTLKIGADLASQGNAGTFIQSNGVHQVGSGGVMLGGSLGTTAKGWYLLSGGQLLVASNISVGNSAAGTFLQSGGLVGANQLIVGSLSGDSSFYQLDDGTLNLTGGFGSAPAFGINRGSFAENGGTLTATRLDLTNSLSTNSFIKTAGFAQFDVVNNSSTFTSSGGTLIVGSFTNTGGRVTLGGSLAFTGNATYSNSVSGIATFNADAGAVTKNLAISATSGTIVFNSSQHLRSLSFSSGRVRLGAASLVLNTDALTVPTTGSGFLDLNTGALIVDYDGGAGTSPLLVVRSVIHGFIRSTLADATHTLGLAEASTIFTSFPANFRGETVDDSSVLVRYTFFGDTDLDGDADGIDIGRWAVNFTGELGGGASATMLWSQGDWDYDGDVDGVDAGLWATAFTGELGGARLSSVVVDDPSLSGQAAQILQGLGVTVVPEPATLLLAASGAAWSLQRSRARRRHLPIEII